MGFNCIYTEGAQGQHNPSAIYMIEVVKSYMPLNYRFMLTHSRFEDPLKCTVSAFNSCTKCLGSSGIIHDCTPNCHPVFWAWMRPHVPDLASFDSNATWVIDVFGLYFWHDIHGCLYNQALADVRSTGAGIECLYCSSWIYNTLESN